MKRSGSRSAVSSAEASKMSGGTAQDLSRYDGSVEGGGLISPRPACGGVVGSHRRCDPGEGESPQPLLSNLGREAPHPARAGRGSQPLFRNRPVGNIPILAVEDRDIERLHRRVVVRGIAIGDAVEKIRRVEAVEVRRLLQDV